MARTRKRGGFAGRKKHRDREVKKRDRRVEMRLLDRYDTENYCRDLEYLARLSFLRDSTKAWIEARMYELRESANRYEHIIGEYLMRKGVEFIHQAPFVFRPHSIYFCDFYIPRKRIAIEVDGIYHNSAMMTEKDAERDYNFKSIGIRVIRIANTETGDMKKLSLRLEQMLGIKEEKKRLRYMAKKGILVVPIELVPDNLDDFDVEEFAKQWVGHPGVIEIQVNGEKED